MFDKYWHVKFRCRAGENNLSNTIIVLKVRYFVPCGIMAAKLAPSPAFPLDRFIGTIGWFNVFDAA
jgi:hypothetical protein